MSLTPSVFGNAESKIMMRAKMQVSAVLKGEGPVVELRMFPVTSKPFDAYGNSEDNTYSKWTPSGSLALSITNPNLADKFEVGQKYYLDFTSSTD